MHRKIYARVDNNSNYNYNSKELETTYVSYYLYGNWWNKFWNISSDEVQYS